MQNAAVHQSDPVGPLLGLLQIVRCQHDGGAVLAELLHGLPRLAIGCPGRWWVRRGRSTPACRTRRWRSRGAAPHRRTAETPSALPARSTTSSTRSAESERPVRRPISRRDSGAVRSGEKPLSWSQDPHSSQARTPVCRVGAVDAHGARGRSAVSFDDLQGRCLASSVGAQQRVELPCCTWNETSFTARNSPCSRFNTSTSMTGLEGMPLFQHRLPGRWQAGSVIFFGVTFRSGSYDTASLPARAGNQ